MKEQVDPTNLRVTYRQPYPVGSSSAIKDANVSTSAREFQYTVTTPFRATGGITLIFKSSAKPAADGQPATGGSILGGLISADIEYVNYGQAHLSAIDNDPAQANFSSANSAIKSEYAAAVNYRLGAELRIGDFRVRGGYGLYATPYQTTSRGGERTVFSGGVGYRNERGYLDLGFSRTTYTAERYSPYRLSTANPASTGPAYLPYSAATAAEPVVSSNVTLLNPTITVGFISRRMRSRVEASATRGLRAPTFGLR